MSHPTQRMTTQFSVPNNTDQKLQDMLTLYKSPATIRDMKQVFFYTQATSGLTQKRVEWTLYGINAYDRGAGGGGITLGANYEEQAYYGLIGTTRVMNIADKINDLIDIRVPKDKYVVEINLVEATIEADPSNWVNLPDRAIINNGSTDPNENPLSEQNLYQFVPKLGAVTSIGTDPDISFQDYTQDLVNQSLRQSEPQTLYVRIKELSNGEPYNWSVTNSGQFSQDKSHQLHVRHGDVNFANLTLEFGHMAFEGDDLDYRREVGVPDAINGVTDSPNFNKNTYRQYQYVDYNTQRHNPYSARGGPDEPEDNYVSFYRGNYRRDLETDFNNTSTNNFAINRQIMAQNVKTFESPANRYPWQKLLIPLDASAPSRVFWYFSGKPYLFNQQVSRINFRFLVRIVHLF